MNRLPLMTSEEVGPKIRLTPFSGREKERMELIDFASERMASRAITCSERTYYYITLESAIDGRGANNLIPAGNFCR